MNNNTNTTTIQITDDFIGVLVNGKRAGFMQRINNRWHAKTENEIGIGILSTSVATPEDGVSWIAAHTE